MRVPRRSGFSMIDLLVVLAVLAFLAALLLPAVQKVRQAAQRTQAQNNLKQIGLGALNYESTYKRFPAGNDANNFSAAAQLLPFVEQDNVYKTINFQAPSDGKANAEVRGIIIPLFVSPLDPQKVKGGEAAAPTNYLFSAGSKYALKDNDGVCYQDSKVRLADVVDGTSNTLLAGETLRGDGGKEAVDVRRQNVRLGAAALKGLKRQSGAAQWKANKDIAGDRGARWIDGRFLQGTFTGTRVLNDPLPDVDCGGEGGLSGLRSLEPRANVCFCDGHVVFLGGNVSREAWRLLTARNDGQPLPDLDK